MSTRQRNSILFFLQDANSRKELLDAARADDWNAYGAESAHDAFRLFGELGDSLALVVTDDLEGPDEGKHRGMLGVDFLQQRSLHMFIANVPFVLLMSTRQENVRAWVVSSGNWAVFMPKRTRTLLTLFAYLERRHRPPSKPQPRSGEL